MKQDDITLQGAVLEAIKGIKRPIKDETEWMKYLRLQLIKEILCTGQQK